MTLDEVACEAIETVEQRPEALGPIPFPGDLLTGRRRRRLHQSAVLTMAAVTRVDPTSDLVEATIPVGRPTAAVSEFGAVTWHPALAASARSVWVTDPGAGELVWRIDPDRNAVTAAVRTGHVPVALAASAKDVWAANQDDTVSRIDAWSGRVTATIRVAAASDLPQGELAIAVGAGAVWVSDGRARMLSRIDPASDRVTASIRLPLQPGGVAATAGGVWVEHPVDGAVSRIDPRVDRIFATLRVVDEPTGELGTAGVAATVGTVWIAAPQEDTLLRIDPAGFSSHGSGS